MHRFSSSPGSLLAAVALGVSLFVSACTSGDAETAIDTSASSTSEAASPAPSEPNEASSAVDCEATAALFVTRGSANPDLEDPEVSATCEGGNVVITTNAVPDYTYIGTSPGVPGGREFTFMIPAEPTLAEAVTAVPYIGTAAVTLGGIPIYGPTEGTGGDVDSLPGIISACGSHNGPTGFHAHKILASTETDCLFTPEEVAAAPQLVGYALDGFPIYTGIDQYTSSWQLTDESLFASDTWSAHTYVEGSGDLDQCNGLTDADGNYGYYTTAEFPYVVGCFAGEIDLQSAGGGGEGGDRDEPVEGEERPERPTGDDGEERPEPPQAGEDE